MEDLQLAGVVQCSAVVSLLANLDVGFSSIMLLKSWLYMLYLVDMEHPQASDRV